MHLVQILLPLQDNERRHFDPALFAAVGAELTEKFGGLTSYLRSPAEGLWSGNDQRTTREDIVIFEVMAAALDRGWWRDYRRELERRFEQDVVVIRASDIAVI